MDRRWGLALLALATAPGLILGELPVHAQGKGVPLPAPHNEDEPPEDEPGTTTSAQPPPPPAAPPAGKKPRPAILFKDGMLRIPGGRFGMGAQDAKAPPNERPVHVEVVAAFWIDKTEVSVGAYKECVEAHGCAEPRRTSALCTYEMGDPLLPISCVPWKDAEAYCRASGKRLPREAEWEFAARGPSSVAYPWGGGASCALAATLIHDATGRSCTGRKPAHIGSRPFGASTFGVLDMSGNVEEWTSDWYSETGGAAPTSGASHVLRGGGWLSPPSQSKTTSRNWGSVLEAGPNVGFRCAKDDG